MHGQHGCTEQRMPYSNGSVTFLYPVTKPTSVSALILPASHLAMRILKAPRLRAGR